jgi:hypothetical protein
LPPSSPSNECLQALAYHAALGLFHLRDWTFYEHKGDANFPFADIGTYQTYLKTRCNEFGYMRDLANAVKHAVLDPKKRPSTQMVGLANTEVQAVGAAFDPSSFSGDAFDTEIRTIIVSKTSPTEEVEFESAAEGVKQMWDQIFVQFNW